MRCRSRELAIAATFAIVLGALAARTLILGKLHNLRPLLETSQSVLEGWPQWRAFQNRLPSSAFEYYWSRALERIAGLDHAAGFVSYLALCCVTLAFIHVLIGRHQLGSLSRAMAYPAAALLATLLLQDDRWLYPWDLPEAIVFALFFLGIVTRWPLAAFAALYALAVTMKETAVFMGVWLCLQSVDFRRVLPGARAADLRPTAAPRRRFTGRSATTCG